MGSMTMTPEVAKGLRGVLQDWCDLMKCIQDAVGSKNQDSLSIAMKMGHQMREHTLVGIACLEKGLADSSDI